jgi:alkylation response protein AidB-like acyl-CoA dehydrogenase
MVEFPRSDTPDQKAVRELAASVARERYAPLAATWDLERASFPKEERRYLGGLGLLGIALPEKFGGSGRPIMDALIVIEELAKVCRPAAFQVFGSCTQQEQLLPRVISGDITIAVAISEPDAGSAATDLRTRATLSDGVYTVNGGKRWISNGGEADYYVVYARMSDDPGAKGVGALIINADSPGVSFGSQEKLMGFRGIPSADVLFDEVRVPEDQLLVDAGGFRQLFGAFSIERLGNSTMSLAIAQEALDRSLAFVQTRFQFGKPLIEFQSIQLSLADMALQVEAARLLIERAADTAGTGVPDALEVSLAKCTANEMAKRVTDLAMQLHGGNGYSEDYGLERLHRDAHGWALAGGTPTMQRLRIASQVLGRSFDQRK